MPGYYLHLAACNATVSKNRSFICGVEAPDILKMHIKMYGREGAKAKYDEMKTPEMPEYSTLEERANQVEVRGSLAGMHYGKSSSTNVLAFWDDLSEKQREMPFYKGYLWHLLTDAIIYGRLDIDAKFTDTLKSRNVSKKNWAIERAKEVDILHEDWDKTNEKVRNTYPDVKLTPEVEELGVVGFNADDNLTYVEWDLIKDTIDYLRMFNPLEADLDEVIEIILSNI